MTIDDYLKTEKTKITRSVIMHLINLGVISEQLTYEDRLFLDKLRKIWKNHSIIRAQLAGMDKVRRENLVFTADLKYAWSRDLMTRVFNMKLNGKYIILKALINEIAEFRPALRKELAENPDFVLKESRRIKRKAERFVERYRFENDKINSKKCPTCGRGFRKTDYQALDGDK